uniref:Uncharacterized protein n=1 Tax=Rhizophora mucronata TaxID=61149 RepID=A0A2P2QEL4_RHIMU
MIDVRDMFGFCVLFRKRRGLVSFQCFWS